MANHKTEAAEADVNAARQAPLSLEPRNLPLNRTILEQQLAWTEELIRRGYSELATHLEILADLERDQFLIAEALAKLNDVA